MTEEQLKIYWGEQIKVVLKDGQTIIGHASFFSSAYDNEPEEASLIIETEDEQTIEIFQGEIEFIEEIDKN